MFRGLGGATLVLFGADSVGVPPWLYMVGTLAGSGVFVRYYMAKVEKRIGEATASKTLVETSDLEDKIRRNLIADTEQRLAIMAADLAKSRAELEKERALRVEDRAEANRRMAAMRQEIERLHDEVAALRVNEATGKRWSDKEDR